MLFHYRIDNTSVIYTVMDLCSSITVYLANDYENCS
jgi:hypothetical protein